jgi:ABC-type uncharacterized transport system permease subunit
MNTLEICAGFALTSFAAFVAQAIYDNVNNSINKLDEWPYFMPNDFIQQKRKNNFIFCCIIFITLTLLLCLASHFLIFKTY